MNRRGTSITYKGRIPSLVVFVVVQFLIGIIHVFSGVLLLLLGSIATISASMKAPEVYSIYTLLFGLLIFIFTYAIWMSKRWGWIGTVAISILVILIDSLTLLNLPSIPGIPKFAAVVEIIYGLLILLYLSQIHVRAIFFRSQSGLISQ
jgi:hypothetical protein